MSDKKLDRMKKEYNRYEVPEELKQKMEESIERAKRGKNRNVVWIWARRSGAVVAAAMLSLFVLTNTSSVAAQVLEKIPVIGAFTKVITFRTYTDQSDNFEAKVEIPQIIEDKESNEELTESQTTVNKSVKEYTDELIARYEGDMKEYGEEGHEAMDSSYEVIADNDRLFTLRVDTVISVGSSDAFSKFYHIDKAVDKIITLKDLFAEDSNYVTVISEEIIKQMKEQMAEDESKTYFIDDEMGDEFNFKAIKEDQNFYVKDSKLVIAFDKYEVTPGYMGQPEFTISPETIHSILAENSILK